MPKKTLILTLLASASVLSAQTIWQTDFESYATGTNQNLGSLQPADWSSSNTNGARNTNIQDQTFDTILSGQYLDFDQNTAAGGGLSLVSSVIADSSANSLFAIEFDLHDRAGATNVTTFTVSFHGSSGTSSRSLLVLDDGVATSNDLTTANYSEGSDLTFRLLVNGGEASAGGLSANSYSLFINDVATNIADIGLGGTGTFVNNYRNFTITGDNTATGLDGLYFDNMSVSAVPEPSAYGMILGSFVLSSILLRRRK